VSTVGEARGGIMRVRIIAAVLTLVLVGAACSSGSSEPQQSPPDTEATDTTLQVSTETTDTETEALDTTTTTAAGDNVFAAAAAGGASATLSLENGETYTFNILCALEPQESAGQEILFTVVSYDDPISLDVSQFGAESLDGTAVISLYDSVTFNNVWDANTLHGGELKLDLSGDTVSGHGVFLAGEERTGPGVAGEFEAHC
jgi:ABC-type transport system substrate-binding protein